MRFQVLKEFFIPIPNDPKKQNFVVFVKECQVEAEDADQALEIAKREFGLTIPIVCPV